MTEHLKKIVNTVNNKVENETFTSSKRILKAVTQHCLNHLTISHPKDENGRMS